MKLIFINILNIWTLEYSNQGDISINVEEPLMQLLEMYLYQWEIVIFEQKLTDFVFHNEKEWDQYVR